ncbi:MAG TPA: thioredoxin family protein [Neobacillus sp.]|jgi:thiol-disulfide isomerase/thioredoxin
MNEWNREEHSSFLENKSTGLIYFYTPFCGTCQMASKMLLVTEKMINIDIGKMNLNFYPDLAQTYAIESVPCLLFVQNGQVVETIYAFHSIPYLLEKINEHLT